ncbi:HepT-like ribonuclease domain-containing protein [Salegentibacter sp. HM20]
MDDRILKWLFDIKIAIEEIDSYFEGTQIDFQAYKKNLMLKRAVERDLEIIGEAINRIIKRDPEFTHKITNAKAIIGLRNQVIHAYDNISDENIWSILITHLPKLKTEIDSLIVDAQEN